MKQCKVCGEIKELSEFRVDKTVSSGHRSVCRICKRILDKEYRKNNIEHTRKMDRRYRKSHPEKMREISQRRRNKNIERERERIKKWRREHSDRQHSSEKNWRKNNPDKLREKYANRRARLRGSFGIVKMSDFVDLCNKYNNKCLCCGNTGKLTMDHVIPLILGGNNTIENIQPLCGNCNSKKGIKVVDYRIGVDAILENVVTSSPTTEDK